MQAKMHAITALRCITFSRTHCGVLYGLCQTASVALVYRNAALPLVLGSGMV